MIFTIPIYVKIDPKKTVCLKLKPSDLINNERTTILGKEGIPLDQQLLICDDEKLADMQTPVLFNIKEEDNFKCIKCARGPMTIMVVTPSQKKKAIKAKGY